MGRRGRRRAARAVVVGEADEATTRTATTARRRRRSPEATEAAKLGRRDGRGGRRRTGRDRLRRTPERRQVEPRSTRCSARTGRSSRDIPGTTRDAIDTRLAWGRSEVVLIDTAGIRRRGKVASGPAAERYSTLRALQRAVARRRRGPRHRCRRGPDGAGRPRRGLRRRGGQGPRRRGQQVGPGRRQDRPHVRPVHRVDPQRGPVPRLRADRLDQRQDRPARRARARGGRRHLGASAAGGSRPASSTGSCCRRPSGRRRRRSAAAARSSSTRPRPPSRRRRSSSSRRTPRRSTSRYRRYLENRLRETFGFDGTPIRLVFRDRASVKLPRRKKRGVGAGHRSARRRGRAAPDSRGHARSR